MTDIIVYSKANCSWCDRAKQLLNHKQVTFREIRVDTDDNQRAEMERLSGQRTVPQIFINGQAIGGFDDLSALDKAGKLDLLLQK